MDFQNIIFEKEAGIAVITLNRPKAMNALSTELVTELVAAMDAIAVDSDIRAIVLTGGERVFAAGGDIVLMSTADPLGAENYANMVGQALAKIEEVGLPVIAAVSGMALGGG